MNWYLPAMIDYVNQTASSPYNLTSDGLIPEEDYVEALEWWMEVRTFEERKTRGWYEERSDEALRIRIPL